MRRTLDHPVPPEVELCAFRIVEAIVPPEPRGTGAPVQVRVDRTPGALRLSVDRIVGPPPRTVLAALRERTDAVGGSLATASDGTAGWPMDVSLPVTEVVRS